MRIRSRYGDKVTSHYCRRSRRGLCTHLSRGPSPTPRHPNCYILTNSSTLRQPFAAYIPFSWMDASRPEETATLPLEAPAAAKGDLPGNDDDEQRRVENAQLAVVPPYWQHRRYESYTSTNIVRPPAIILEDHTEDWETNRQTPLWAKEVSLQDYVVVSGNIPSVGDYVVWTCTIKTLDVGPSSSSTPSNFSSLAEFLLHASLQGGSITMRKRSIFYQALKSQAKSFVLRLKVLSGTRSLRNFVESC